MSEKSEALKARVAKLKEKQARIAAKLAASEAELKAHEGVAPAAPQLLMEKKAE